MKYLIIGSNSCSGSNFSRFLIERGNRVVGVSRSDEPAAVFLPYKWDPDISDQFTFQKIDINKNMDDLGILIKDYNPEYVVNFSAQGMVAQSWDNPEHWYQTNIVSQARLFSLLKESSVLNRYVHVTTPEVYGGTLDWIKESTEYSPSTPYAVSRAACDMHLQNLYREYDFPVVFTRSSNVYGPGQQLYRIIPRTILFALTGRKLQLHGGGLSTRSFIHINDVVKATYLVGMKGTPGSCYHISTRKTLTIRSLVEIICNKVGVSFEDLVAITEDRLGKDDAYLLDSSFIRDQMDWTDEVELNNGIEDTMSWISGNLSTLEKQPLEYYHKA